jgi:hypothetical protein
VILPPIPSDVPSVSDDAAATALRYLEVFSNRFDDPLADDARAVLARYFRERTARRVVISGIAGVDFICTPDGRCYFNE